MRYLFGNYVLDTQRAELHGAGAPLKVRRKVLQVLVYLLAHRDRVVPKHELLEHLWPDQFVGDAVLKTCITALRKALGERGRAPRFVRTLHGQGYRFVAAVEVREHRPPDEVPPARPRHPGEDTTHQAEAPAPALVPPLADLRSTPVEVHDGEHKQLTVLCGALAEVPSLTARLSPEGLYRLLQAWLALVQEVVQQYDGTLTLNAGERFTALFGAPAAQEDHARRAVLAACDLRERCQTALPQHAPGDACAVTMQLGVHSGPVVAGTLGGLPQRPYTAVGEATQVALRLQQDAAPGMVCISATTYALVQEEVESAPAHTLAMAGLSAAVPIYTVYGLRQRRAGVTGHGTQVRSRFVGRAREMALLQASLAQVAQGQGQVIGILGEPGMGKSRLLAEFRQRLAGQAVTYYEGHCLPYGQATPYLPLRDVVRQHCGLRATDPPEAVTAAVHRCVQAAGLHPEEGAAVLLQLLEMPVEDAACTQRSPEERKALTFRVLHQLSQSVCQRQPLVLAVEDGHWIDATSAAWLATLVERLAGTPLLLLVTYRPGYQPPWLGQSSATQVALPRLTPQESLLVVQGVLQTATVPAAVGHEIVTKAAGNPFFLEELSWTARTSGPAHPALTLPTTIQAVLAARLDRLPPTEKRLVQTAAVIGSAVPVPLLQAVTDVAADALPHLLERLQGAELLYETSLVPVPVYTFKHVLTQEVAYGSLLQDQRRALHAQVVKALEALAGDRLAEQVERLAYHALRGEVWDKAVPYCQQAGARALDHGAFHEALAYFDQAIQALTHLPDHSDTRRRAIDLRLAVRRPLVALGEYRRSLALLGEAEALARTLDDRVRLGQVLAHRAVALRQTGDLDGAIAAGQQALDLAAALGDSAMQVQASHSLGQAYYFSGEFGRAAELLRWSVEAADREAGTTSPLRFESRTWLVRTLSALGAFAEGRCHGEDALRLAPLAGRRGTPAMAHNNLGHLYVAHGDLAHAIPVLEQGLALCRAAGIRNQARVIMGDLGYAYALQGRLAEGCALLEEAIREAIRMGAHSAGRVAWLSEVCRLAGRSEEAGQHARQALDLARQRKERGYEAHALHQLGVVQAHADPPDVAQAEAYYQQALALAKELGMCPLQAHCHRGLGTLYATTGQWEQARAALSTAIEMYRAMDMTFWLPETEAALAQVESKRSWTAWATSPGSSALRYLEKQGYPLSSQDTHVLKGERHGNSDHYHSCEP